MGVFQILGGGGNANSQKKRKFVVQKINFTKNEKLKNLSS